MSNRCKKAIKCGSALGCASLGVVMALSFSPFAQGGVHGAFADEGVTSSEQPQQQSYDFKIGNYEYTAIGNRNTFVEVGIRQELLRKLLTGDGTPSIVDYGFGDDGALDKLSQLLAQRQRDGHPGFTKDELSAMPCFKDGAQPILSFKKHKVGTPDNEYKIIDLKDLKKILKTTVSKLQYSYENNTNINEQFADGKKPAFVIRDAKGSIYKDDSGKEAIIPLNILGYQINVTKINTICDDQWENCKPVEPQQEALVGRGGGDYASFLSGIKDPKFRDGSVFVGKDGEVYKLDGTTVENNKPDIKLTKDDIFKHFIGGSKETNPFYDKFIYVDGGNENPYQYDVATQALPYYKNNAYIFAGLLPDIKLGRKNIDRQFAYLQPKDASKQADTEWIGDNRSSFPTKAYVYFKTKDGTDIISTFHAYVSFSGLFGGAGQRFGLSLPENIELSESDTNFANKDLTFDDGACGRMQVIKHINYEAYKGLLHPTKIDGSPLKVSDVLERVTDNPAEKNDYTKPGVFTIKKSFISDPTSNTYAKALEDCVFSEHAPLRDKFLDSKADLPEQLQKGIKENEILPTYILVGQNIKTLGDAGKITFTDQEREKGSYYLPTPKVCVDGKDLAKYMNVSYINDDGKEVSIEKPGEYRVKLSVDDEKLAKNVKDFVYFGEYTTAKKYFVGANFGLSKETHQDFQAAHTYTEDAPYKIVCDENVPQEIPIEVTFKKKNPSGSASEPVTGLKATLDRAAKTINITGTPEKGATYVVSLNIPQNGSEWAACNNTVELTAVESTVEPTPQLIGTLPDIQAETPLNKTLTLLHNNMPANTDFTATLTGTGSVGLEAKVSDDKTKVTVSGTPKTPGDVTLTLAAQNGEKVYKPATMAFKVTPIPIPSISLEDQIDDFQQGKEEKTYCTVKFTNAHPIDYTVSVKLEGDAAQDLNVMVNADAFMIKGTPTKAGTVTLKVTATKNGSPASILTTETTFKVVGSTPAPEPPASEPTLTIDGDVTGAQVGKEFNIQVPFSSTNMPADATFEPTLAGEGSEGLKAEVSADKTKVTVSGMPKKGGKVTLTLTAKKGDTALKTATKEFSVAASETAAPAPSPSPLPGGASQSHKQTEPEKKPTPKEEAPVPSFEQATKRIAGETAEDTMQQIVETAFPDPVKEVVLATSEGYWDALSANSLAGSLNAPVLLTKHGQLPEQTIAELQRLKTSKVVVCGGENAISNDVVAQLKELNIEVERVAGQMASDTANDIAKKLANTDTAVVATSWGYEDALSAASFAYAKKAPIFLADYNTATLDASNIQTMKDKGVKHVYIVGGTAVVSPEVEAQLQDAGIAVERVAGNTAYDTSAKLATKLISLGMSANNMAIATGWGYTDALAGAALCGKQNSVMVLADNTNQTAINDVVAANKQSIKNYYIFGGTSAVGENATNALKGVFTGKDANNEKGDSKDTE